MEYVTSNISVKDGQPTLDGCLVVGELIKELDQLGEGESVIDIANSHHMGDDPYIVEKLKGSVDYCRTQQCKNDISSGFIESYCQNCLKSGREQKWKGWIAAQRVYSRFFEV